MAAVAMVGIVSTARMIPGTGLVVIPLEMTVSTTTTAELIAPWK